MKNEIQLTIKHEMIIEAVKAMKKEDQEDFLEDLIAATSPEFLESIRDARADYKSGQLFEHTDIFGK